MSNVTAGEIRRGRGRSKELEREMEAILEPLGVAVDAAGDVLRHYGYQMDPLAPQVAEIVGCAVNASYDIAYRNLIEFAHRAALPEEAATSRSRASCGPRVGAEGSESGISPKRAPLAPTTTYSPGEI